MRDICAVMDSPVTDGYGSIGLGGDAGVVCDKHDGFAALLELVEGFHDERSRGGVQVARRLVGQNDGWIVDKGARDGDALHLSARQLRYTMVPMVDRKRDGLQRVYGAHLALAARHIGVGQRQHDVFDHRQARQQIKALKDKADAQRSHLGELIIVELGDVEPLQEVIARRRFVQAAQDVHERRLA